MAQTASFGSLFAMMLLTLLVWVYMYIRRIRFLTKSNRSPKHLASRAYGNGKLRSVPISLALEGIHESEEDQIRGCDSELVRMIFEPFHHDPFELLGRNVFWDAEIPARSKPG